MGFPDPRLVHTDRHLEPEVVLDHVQSFARVGFWDYDLRTQQLYLSTQVFEILGMASPSMDDYLAMVHPDDLDALHQVYRRACDQPGPYQIRHRTADGRRLLQLHVQSVASGGTPVRFLGVISDVTTEWQLERALEDSAAARLTGLMAGGAVHDLKNVFTVLLGNIQLVRASTARGAAPDEESLAALERAATSGIELTTQLLQVGHREPLGARPVDVGQLFLRLEATARTALGRRNRAIVDAGPGPAVLLADESRLERAVVDLLLNARDALPPSGGTVELRFCPLDAEHASAWAEELGLAPGTYGVVEIADDGVGMEAEVLARVTDPFFTTKGRHGTGVGLHTVARFVESAGGALRIQSEPGVGTTVRLLLPTLTTSEAPATRRRRSVRVLVHGPSGAWCETFTAALADAGIQSVVADSPASATNVLRTEPIDLLVAAADLLQDDGASALLRVAASRATAVLGVDGARREDVDLVVDAARRLAGVSLSGSGDGRTGPARATPPPTGAEAPRTEPDRASPSPGP